ncbi:MULTISPECIES: hypothetical protein [Mesorhizobium]|uniref:Nodulation-related protein, predicted type III secretion system component n=1 Tax=Mesorhizobium qingshengii TaxID=1165689 RepID=A0A1G5ZYL9_9HYPH|nr:MULTISPECIES: hypothetical protein [Mesorhizobium]MCH4561134.1 hypothetical protein [Mesorhizobium jarvisii]QGU21249.1 hypothetical protein MCHK_13255 [Mesorhizobium huakuii 7653R]SDA99646.1 nodulation-related protein, predicted type III secretion system component [Mesorhizobium qingshengii]
MDVASDRLNHVQASRLRLLKEMQERRALHKMSKTEAKRDMAVLAAQNAARDLAMTQQDCAAAEADLYQELMTLENLSNGMLDRHHLRIELLAAEITCRRQMLGDAQIAQEQAEIAMFRTRDEWIACSAATRKWQQIEDDVGRDVEIHSEAVSETEAEDDRVVRFGRSALAQVAQSN